MNIKYDFIRIQFPTTFFIYVCTREVDLSYGNKKKIEECFEKTYIFSIIFLKTHSTAPPP